MPKYTDEGLTRLETGIPGFDEVALGGLTRWRTTLVAGTAGSGKTVIGLQFLVGGIDRYGENGVLVTFEEAPADMVRNAHSFGWNLAKRIEQGQLGIVDVTPAPGEENVFAGAFDLSGLMARIEHAVRAVGAKRVVLDSIGALFPQLSDALLVRRELHRILAGLRMLGVTTMVTAERVDEDGHVARLGVEEFVVDNVVILRNRLEADKRRRTLEILKLRGAPHNKGEYPFTISGRDGVTVIPLSSIELKQRSSTVRRSSGVAELDRMCGGGMFRDSIVLVSGATGTGKTLLSSLFLNAAIQEGERALLFGFEESREQLFRNAEAWGLNFAQGEEDGLLRVVCRYPEVMSPEDHILMMKQEIAEYRPTRVVVDSMSAFERVSIPRTFREFVIGLTSHIKRLEIAGMFTNTASMLMGGETVTEAHISTLTDSIILLRYVELQGEMRRGITVLKMRGSWHEKAIREYTISGDGMHIQEQFRSVNGILRGNPVYHYAEERERLSEMFDDER